MTQPTPSVETAPVAGLSASVLALVRQARVQQWRAQHWAWAYQYRAAQLTAWRRWIDVLGLVVSPSLIVGFVGLGVDAPRFFKVLVGISATLSTATAALTVTSLIHKWDTQLAFSLTFPSRARTLATRIERLLFAIIDSPADAPNTTIRLQELLDESNALFADLEQNQMYVPPWIELTAQQMTMMDHAASCARCRQEWPQGRRPHTESEAKRFTRKITKYPNHCHACALPLPQEKSS